MMNDESAGRPEGPASQEVRADVLDECATALGAVAGTVGFVMDESGRPRIAGASLMHGDNQYYKKRLEEYDYDGSDEERKKNSRFLAAVRSYKSSVKAAARDYRASMFEAFDEDLALLVGDADDIIRIAEQRKRSSRMKFEESRKAMLSDFLDGAKALDPALDDLSLDDVMDAAWLNRSTSEKHAREALDSRMHVFSDLCALDLMPGASTSEKVGLLRSSGWETTQAIRVFRERERAKADADAAAARRADERRRADEELAGRTVVRLSVANADLGRFRELLDESGIDWKEM